jgi:uncharacterized phage protein (TIGR01671 family)
MMLVSPGRTRNFHIKPETIGQYTGLNDKKGTKIFEGDIVRIENGIDEETIVGCIVYDYASWQIDYGPDSTALWTQLIELAEYKSTEVIGNIHDNPGLLVRNSGDIRGDVIRLPEGVKNE